MTKKEEDIFYLLGYPMGFTPQAYFQLVKGLNKGIAESVNKGEFLNLSTVKNPYTETHYDLIKKHEDGLNEYWCKSYESEKKSFCNQVDKFNIKFYIFRDTVEPKIMYEFLNEEVIKPKGIILDVDTDFLVDNYLNKGIYFPANYLDKVITSNDDKENCRKALTTCLEEAKSNYQKLADKNRNIEIVKLEDFIKKPTILLEIAQSIGYNVNIKNFLGNNVKTISKQYM